MQPQQTPELNLPRWLGVLRVVPMVATAVAFYLVADRGFGDIQKGFCPPRTLLFGPTQIGHIVFAVAPMIVAIPIGLFLANLFELGVRSVVDRQDLVGFRRSATLLLWWVLIASAFAVPAMSAALQSYYCAAEHALTYKSSVLSPLRTYMWSDIRIVRAECFHQGRTNRDSYNLVMSDGTRIDLADKRAAFVAAFPKIRQKLSALRLKFETEHLEDCPDQIKAIFAVPIGAP